MLILNYSTLFLTPYIFIFLLWTFTGTYWAYSMFLRKTWLWVPFLLFAHLRGKKTWCGYSVIWVTGCSSARNISTFHFIQGYGFGFKHSGVFAKLLEECQEILDVKNPDSLTRAERRSRRLEFEDSDFDSDHYLCDLFELDELDYFCSSMPPWLKGKMLRKMKNSLNMMVYSSNRRPVFLALLPDGTFSLIVYHNIDLGVFLVIVVFQWMEL